MARPAIISPGSSPINYYVDPVLGSDGNAGTSAATAFRTIAKAQIAVRSVKVRATGNITVWLRGGYYTYQNQNAASLTSPLVSFGPNDSPNRPRNGTISWAAYPNTACLGGFETPVLSGGVQLTNWSAPAALNGTSAKSTSTANRFRQLYFQQWDTSNRCLLNQMKLTRARYPTVSAQIPKAPQPLYPTIYMNIPSSWTIGGAGASSLTAQAPAQANLYGQTAASYNNTEVVLRKTDSISRLPLTNVTASSGASLLTFYNDKSGASPLDMEVCSTLSSWATSPICPYGGGKDVGYYGVLNSGSSTTANTPFYYENNIAFVQNPGDWYQDSVSGTVYTVPPSGYSINNWPPANGFIIAPQGASSGTEQQVLVDIGVPPAGQSCSSYGQVTFLQFVGLAFSHTNWLYPSQHGYVGAAAPNHYVNANLTPVDQDPAAVQLGCTAGVTFSQNLFSEIGGVAVSDRVVTGPGTQLTQNTGGLIFSDNAFIQTAGDALVLTGTGASNIQITSNLFTQIGQDYGGAGIVVAKADSLSVLNNDLRFISSDGIFTSQQPTVISQYPYWTIEENVLSDIAEDMNDVGAIYSNYNNESNFPDSAATYPGTPNGQPMICICLNIINAISTPNWLGSTPSHYGYATPHAIYLDQNSEFASVFNNYLTNIQDTVDGPFHLNCESTDSVLYNNTPLSVTYNGSCSPTISGAKPTVAVQNQNNGGSAFTFPDTPGISTTDKSLWGAYMTGPYGTSTQIVTSVPPH